jgi:shikimate dehydrogenase
MTAEVHWTGACNVIRRNRDGSLAGTLLDGEGFVTGLAQQQFDVRDKRVLLLGAGGAAAGIAFALAKYGVQSLHIRNRTASKAELLVKKLKLRFPAINLQSGPYQEKDFDLVINATPLGMYDDDPLPLSEKFLQPHMWVADVVVNQEVTPLLACAQQKGCHTHGGKWMLETQLEQMLDFMLEQ